MNYFWVFVILCSPDMTYCEKHKALKPGNGLPMECFIQGQEVAKRYIREDLQVYRIQCGKERITDATQKGSSKGD